MQQNRSHCGGKTPKRKVFFFGYRRWKITLPENLKLSPFLSFLKGKERCPNTREFSGQGRWAVNDIGRGERNYKTSASSESQRLGTRGDQVEPEDSKAKVSHSLSDQLRHSSSWTIFYVSQDYSIKSDVLRQKLLSIPDFYSARVSVPRPLCLLDLRSIPVPWPHLK